MRMNHTAEPWRTYFYDPIGHAIAAGPDVPDYYPSKMVVDFGSSQDGDTVSVISKENADRAVACVNACAGIADPSVVPDLLAALDRFSELADHAHSDLGMFPDCCDEILCPYCEARALVARVKGGAA